MDPKVNQNLAERFVQLPKVVQNAITSADVERQLRKLVEIHKLHLDQWELLENEVMLALLGLQPVDGLQKNIQTQVGVPQEIATELATDISKIVFDPIRRELERELGSPQAKESAKSDVEVVREQVLAAASVPPPASVVPATPPAPAPAEKAARAPVSENYKAGESSSTRTSVHDDPYREPPA